MIWSDLYSDIKLYLDKMGFPSYLNNGDSLASYLEHQWVQFAHNNGNIVNCTLLNGGSLSSSNLSLYNKISSASGFARSLICSANSIVKALNPFLGLLNQTPQRGRNVVCTALGDTASGGEPPGTNKPEKEFDRRCLRIYNRKDPVVVQKGLDCLDNPVLRGSFLLVLSEDRLIFLEQVAKNAWIEITSQGLRDESNLVGPNL